MSKKLIIATGDDPRTAPVLEYLDKAYGIPPEDIQSLTLTSTVGEAQTITVTVYVREEIPEVL